MKSPLHPLRPCPSCSRHVRVIETQCLFCGAALAPTTPATPPTPARSERQRLGRAALFAFGTAASIAACAGGSDPTGDASVAETGSGSDAGIDRFTTAEDTGGGGGDTGRPDTGCIAKPYGAPPADGMMMLTGEVV